MKHSVTLKFIAILLAACAVVAAAGSAVGIALSIELETYTTDFEDWYQQRAESRAEILAGWITDRYAANTFSDCSEEVLNDTNRNPSDYILSGWYDVSVESWTYTISDQDGNMLEIGETGPENITFAYTFILTGHYPVQAAQSGDFESSYRINDINYYVNYEESPEYTVTIVADSSFFTSYNGMPLEFIQVFFSLRYGFMCILAASLLIFAICMVYLCCAAGKASRNSEASPAGLNRLPLDLYGALTAGGCFLLAALAWEILENWFLYNSVYNVGAVALAATVLLVAAVLGIGFLFAVAAQCKTPGRYWWHHSVIGWCCCTLLRALRFLFRGLHRLLDLLPLVWQWLLIAAAMGFVPLFFFYLAAVGRSYWLLPLFLSVLADIAVVCYGAYAFGVLLKGARRMAAGELYTKMPTRYLFGAFARCAGHLNTLADVAVVAAKNQMKSERMKTELITNVSHDIKTPLTSIINYVDLLEKSHTEEERAQYLEVLGRQSQRLKKLIEDLMDMSKATTGNIAVDITQVDAGETVNQALGEFADKLAAAGLTPIFRQPEGTVAMQADGRLTWRVLSNLLSNIVKYALPGTRVYIDLMQLEGRVLISLKNISREELNVSADELTERFVRGDTSRNTEGSGLGLNIAKSLMELQKGQLQLLVDGDLFKVTLIFPTQ